MVTAALAGSFDPITNGHLNLIQRSLKFCSKLYVIVAVNPSKSTLFSEQERIDLINKSINSLDFLDSTNVNVISYSGLIVNFAKENDVDLLIRGVRSNTDYEYEVNLASINKMLNDKLETILLTADQSLSQVSSSAVKELWKFEADVSKFVPESVSSALAAKKANLKK